MTGILFSLFRQLAAAAPGVHPANPGLREPKARQQTTNPTLVPPKTVLEAFGRLRAIRRKFAKILKLWEAIRVVRGLNIGSQK
jgi:hypothetical protein